MSEANCVVKIVDDHGVEHSVRVKAESLDEAAILGLNKLEKHGWESDGSQIGWVVVEIHDEPTVHRIHVEKMLGWVKSGGKHLLPRPGEGFWRDPRQYLGRGDPYK